MFSAFILQGLAVDESVSPVIAFLHEKGCKEMVACLQNAVNVTAKGPEYVNALSSLGQGWIGEEATPKEWLAHLELKGILASQAEKLLFLVQ